MTTATHPQDWQGLLAKDEEILWQGRPGSRVHWSALLTPRTLMGVFFTGFALFWISAAASMTGGGNFPFVFRLFPLFGIPFLLAGLNMLGGHAIWDAFKRANTHYTLTNRTAFIARNTFGKRTLRSYPIAEMDRILLEDGDPGSVIFSDMQSGPDTRPGYYQIDDAREVFAFLREAQRALRKAGT
jgi:hypothetical protein